MAQVMPRESVQQRFREAADLALGPSDSEQAKRRYEELTNGIKDDLDGNKVEILRQWLYCYHTYVRSQEGARRSDLAIAMQGMLSQFGLEPRDFAYAFYPLLDTADTELHDVLVEFLGRNDRTREGERDFEVYEEILEAELKRTNVVPQGLIQYMYEKAPAVALLTMVKLDGHGFERLESALMGVKKDSGWPPVGYKKLTLTKEHDRSTIRTELEKLSGGPEWWVQHFVGEFIAQVPEVGTDAIRERLSKSEHQLVKKLLADADKYQKKVGDEKPVD